MKSRNRIRTLAFILIALFIAVLSYQEVSARRKQFLATQLKVEEETYQAYTDLGYERLDLDDLDGAINDFDRAQELHPYECINIYSGRAQAYFEQGDMESALAEYETAFAVYPEPADVYFSRGLLFLKNGDYPKAIADYNEAIVLKVNAESYFNRGTAYLLDGQIGHAMNDYREGLRLQRSDKTPN